MNLDLTTILHLAYIIAIGIAFAIIYTNIQRSAYAKFVSALFTEEVFSEDKAKTLKELEIKGIDKLIIKSAVKNKHSLGKSVSSFSENSSNDALESFLSGSHNDLKYYIHDDNHSALSSKYDYTPIKFSHMIGYLLALIVAMAVFTFGVKMFFDTHITPKLESEQQEKAEEQIADFENNQNEESTDHQDDDSSTAVIPTLN